MDTDSSQLSEKEREALVDFLEFRLPLDEFGKRIKGRMTFDFRPSHAANYTRGVTKSCAPAKPPVVVTRRHLIRAHGAWKREQVSLLDLKDWASMLTMNDDYELVESESELIAEWLNTIVVDGIVTDPNPC